MNINVVGRKYIFFAISGLLIFLSIAAMIVFGFREGIDFQGGTLWKVHFESNVNESALSGFFESKLNQEVLLSREASSQNVLIRMGNISEADHQEYAKELAKEFGNLEELSFQSIGPSVGRELRSKAITAFVLALFAISIYIAYAFRKVSHPVSSWKYGLVALVALFHDAIIPLGVLSVMGFYLGVEIDTSLIVALLVIVGFSVHDTIVVFDRVRENLLSGLKKEGFGDVVNTSINQTLARSINTSLTLYIVLVALYFWGPPSLQNFVLTILIGTVAGAYSSIFIASPLLVVWEKLSRK